MLRCKKEEGTSLASLFPDMLQILARDDLCVESEGVLLDLVLRWAEDKVRGNISACGGLTAGKVDIEEKGLVEFPLLSHSNQFL